MRFGALREQSKRIEDKCKAKRDRDREIKICSENETEIRNKRHRSRKGSNEEYNKKEIIL